MQELIANLEKKADESKLLRRVANDLRKPTRVSREINLSKINRFTKENEIIIVPGKVLGGGELDHKLTISAFKFSGSALTKIEKSGSKIIPLDEISKEPLAGKKIRIIG